MTHMQLIMGLPKAGKTTFIAALWYVVETCRVPGALELVELPKNRKHLNDIRKLWVMCEEQKHTSLSAEREVQIKLRASGSPEIIELVVPDLSGESFELQWSHRQWSRVYHEMASRATGAILFVHPNQVLDAPTIPEEEVLGEVLRSEPSPDALTPSTTPTVACDSRTSDSEQPWDAAFSPQQVKLVELLQFLTVRPLARTQLRLAVVISAWDLAKRGGISPEKWLSRRMPLLDQYLRANREVYQSRVYGLSATGGDLTNDADLRRLSALRDPTERIEIVGTGVNDHDVTAPVRYVMMAGS